MENHKHRELLKEVLTGNDWRFSTSQPNFLEWHVRSAEESQAQTNEVFTEKWSSYNSSEEKERLYDMQRRWYLDLYGFPNEQELAAFLRTKNTIFDAGCGLGYKAAWFAELAPESLIVAMDFSEAAELAAKSYVNLKNLVFLKGDIAETKFRDGSIDYVSCDQVIMHTEDPDATLTELARITNREDGQLACYFYRKKALPRELLDDYFRIKCTKMSNEELWQMSRQLTELGKTLSELDCKVTVPDIPALDIRGGEYDLQRFLYWNFLKCFYSAELGNETSVATNFDWYSPSNARRFSEEEVKGLVKDRNLEIEFFHVEEAAFSGRFSWKSL